MKKWERPVIRTMDERELLQKLSVKAESGPVHTDAHTDSGFSDGGHTNSHVNSGG